MKVYLGDNGNTTSFRISQQILDNYNNNKFNKQWNEEALKERWKWFFEQLENILNIDCQDLINEGEPFLN